MSNLTPLFSDIFITVGLTRLTHAARSPSPVPLRLFLDKGAVDNGHRRLMHEM